MFTIKNFKSVALIEGISAILLFFFAMPMKYAFDMPIFVKYIGMIHGILFSIYIVFATILKFSEKWNFGKFLEICLASIPPFGTFYIEKKYLRNA
jgi:integral membrane protein